MNPGYAAGGTGPPMNDYEQQKITTWRLRELLDREKEREALMATLKKLVIAWDADQDLEFDEGIDEARQLLGFKLAEPTNR